MPAAGQHTQHRAEQRAARDRLDDPLQFLAARHQAADVRNEYLAFMLVLQVAQDLRDPEHADCDGHEVDAVRQFPEIHREARRASR